MRWQVALLLAGAVVAPAALADDEAGQPPTPPPAERRLAERFRDDPSFQVRMHDAWRYFHQLPEDRQARLRQLDQDLAAADPARRARLTRVLERYALWLGSLPEEQRRSVLEAPDDHERLRRVKALREAEWLRQLYPEERQAFLKTPPGEERERLRQELRFAQRERRRDWLVAFHHLDDTFGVRGQPARLKDFPPWVQHYVTDYLQPLLNKGELERLSQAEGNWPLYPRVLVELADRNPVFLPGKARGPSGFLELPEDVRNRVMQKSPDRREEKMWRARLLGSEGKWPEFAMAFSEYAKARKVELPRQLGPSTPAEFSPRVQRFLKERLLPLLDEKDRTRLQAAEGSWPSYPRLLLELAGKHNLRVPGDGARLSLPGPRDMWERYRTQPALAGEQAPDLPDRTLRDFARDELGTARRADWPLFTFDPFSRLRLQRAYYDRHPQALEQSKGKE